MNATQLCERMENRYECSYERRSVYADISLLKEYGLKIEQLKGKSFGYYVAQRDFDLPELKLLVPPHLDISSKRRIADRLDKERPIASVEI